MDDEEVREAEATFSQPSPPHHALVESFDETDKGDQASVTTEESVFNYAGSYQAFHPADSLLRRAYIPLQLQQASSEAAARAAQKNRKLCNAFDMRENSDVVRGKEIPQDEAFVAKQFDISINRVTKFPNDVDGKFALILHSRPDEKYLIIKTMAAKYCLRITPHTSVSKIQHTLKTVTRAFRRERTFRRLRTMSMVDDAYYTDTHDIESPSLYQDDSGMQKSFLLLYQKKEVTVADLLKLPSMSVVEAVVIMPLFWQIYHRYKLHCDKRYRVFGRTHDTLADLKQNFLNLYRETEAGDEIPLDCVWFTKGDKLVSEKLMKQTFEVMLTNADSVHDILDISRASDVLKVHFDQSKSQMFIDNVFVHFQPPDAVYVPVQTQTTSRKAACDLIMVAPQMSPSALRDQVSKVVGQQANSIKINIGRAKLNNRIDLRQALAAPNCKITVAPKDKIKLSVHVVWVPDDGRDDETEMEIHAYSYDMVEVTKVCICQQKKLVYHKMDLYFEGHLLSEHSTLSEHRIRDKDRLEARVFPRRLKLTVRMPTRRWYDLFVDDSSAASVKDIKVIAQTLDREHPVSAIELTAIASGTVLSDTTKLEDLEAGECGIPRVVLVHTENCCFSAATAYDNTFIICVSMEGSCFQQKEVMWNGKRLFYGQDMSNDRWEIADMMEKRRHNLQPAQSAPSIRTVPRDSLHKTDPGDSLLPRDDCSSSTPSRASLASTPNPETSPEQILPGESGCGEITKDSASRSPRPHQRRRKRQGSVRFHTGNSISDLESAGELDTSAAEESLQTPGTDGTDAEDDMSTSTTHAEIQPAQRGQISAVANVESEPEQPVEKPRSTSCPPAPRADNQQPFGQSVAKRSNSVDHFAGGNTSLISTTIHQQIARSLDGMWDLQQMVSTTARLTPEDAQQCLNTYQSSLMSPVPAVGWSQQVHDQSSQTLPHSLPDPVFKNISEKCIRTIAKHLGSRGVNVMRALLLPEGTIDNARQAHSTNPEEMYYSCLKAWCRREGSQASMEKLKAALREEDSNDLVEMLNSMEMQAVQASASAESDQSGNE